MLKLLIAEDERPLLKVLCRLLSKDYEVVPASDGSEALSVLLGGGCDLAVMDVMMPGLSGIEAAKEARKAGVGAPILLLTALSDTCDKVAGLDGGANDYLTKPFEAEELAARLRSLSRLCAEKVPDTIGDIRSDRQAGRMEGPSGQVGICPAEAAMLLALSHGEPVPVSRLAAEASSSPERVPILVSYLSGKLSAVRSGMRIAETPEGFVLERGGHAEEP